MEHPRPKRLSLIIGIGVPVAVLALMVFVVVVPRSFADPQEDFLYAVVPWSGEQGFSTTITDGHPVFRCSRTEFRTDVPRSETEVPCDALPQPVALYVHETQRNANRAVSLADAAALVISPTDVSPDGYRFRQAGSDGDVFIFPFFYGGGSGSYEVAKERNARKSVDLADAGRGQVQFVGWLENTNQ